MSAMAPAVGEHEGMDPRIWNKLLAALPGQEEMLLRRPPLSTWAGVA